MTDQTTDQERREIVTSYFDLIETAVKTARMHMADDEECRPELVDFMFVFIERLTAIGKQFKWPDPSKLALAARQDRALQKLIKSVCTAQNGGAA